MCIRDRDRRVQEGDRGAIRVQIDDRELVAPALLGSFVLTVVHELVGVALEDIEGLFVLLDPILRHIQANQLRGLRREITGRDFPDPIELLVGPERSEPGRRERIQEVHPLIGLPSIGLLHAFLVDKGLRSDEGDIAVESHDGVVESGVRFLRFGLIGLAFLGFLGLLRFFLLGALFRLGREVVSELDGSLCDEG